MHGTDLYKTLQILTYVFNWLFFTQCVTSIFSIDRVVHLYAWFLILFHVTYIGFSQSTHLLMCLSLKILTLTYSGGTDGPGELCYNLK